MTFLSLKASVNRSMSLRSNDDTDRDRLMALPGDTIGRTTAGDKKMAKSIKYYGIFVAIEIMMYLLVEIVP